jgi:hypothetical protein
VKAKSTTFEGKFWNSLFDQVRVVSIETDARLTSRKLGKLIPRVRNIKYSGVEFPLLAFRCEPPQEFNIVPMSLRKKFYPLAPMQTRSRNWHLNNRDSNLSSTYANFLDTHHSIYIFARSILIGYKFLIRLKRIILPDESKLGADLCYSAWVTCYCHLDRIISKLLWSNTKISFEVANKSLLLLSV